MGMEERVFVYSDLTFFLGLTLEPHSVQNWLLWNIALTPLTTGIVNVLCFHGCLKVKLIPVIIMQVSHLSE